VPAWKWKRDGNLTTKQEDEKGAVNDERIGGSLTLDLVNSAFLALALQGGVLIEGREFKGVEVATLAILGSEREEEANVVNHRKLDHTVRVPEHSSLLSIDQKHSRRSGHNQMFAPGITTLDLSGKVRNQLDWLPSLGADTNSGVNTGEG